MTFIINPYRYVSVTPGSPAGTSQGLTWAQYPSWTSVQNAGRQVERSDNSWSTARASLGKTTGKVYLELNFPFTDDSTPHSGIGILDGTQTLSSYNSYLGNFNKSAMLFFAGDMGGPSFATGITIANAPSAQTISTSDRWAIAMDITNGKAWIAKNNTWLTGDPAGDSSPWLTWTPDAGTWSFGCVIRNGGDKAYINIPSTTTYTAPAGFVVPT